MKLIGYAPDLDPTIQGVITDCSAFVPSEKGMRGAPSAQDIGATALAAQCYGAATLRRLDDSFRTVAGTRTKLYDLIANVWTDQTRAVGGDYNVGADGFWRFAQFGDTLLAANKGDVLQQSTTTTFSDVTGSPQASIVETVGNRVVLADTTDGSFGDDPNRWWVSGERDHTDWTPSAATNGCATNTLVSTSGRIFAAKKFGEQIVFYKERAMYQGTFVGAPLVLDVQQIPGDAGCSSQEAVVNVGTADNPVHIFMGVDDFYRFDGARPVPLGGPLRKTVFAELDATYAYKIKHLHDRVNSRIYFYYPSNAGAGAIDKCVVYNYRSNVWGRDDRTIEVALEFLTGGITYDTLDVYFATYDALPTDISYDSPFWTGGTSRKGFFDTSHMLNSLDGVATNSSFTTGDFGDDDNFYLLSRVKPVWLEKPQSATMTNFYKDSEGDTLTTDQTTTMGLSRFDVLRSARWHRLQFDMVGDNELNTINAKYQQDGEE
jgi:hypothetical protein